MCLGAHTQRNPYRAPMSASSTVTAAPVDPATALADALQSGFAAQRGGHQRRRAVPTR